MHNRAETKAGSPDWHDATGYAFAESLDAAGWAWQFLRRCPEYRADYAWFDSVWQALEAEYGVPPQRDYFRWKQDPRAWRPEAEIAGCGTEACPGENDQVLIECWMGAKWGFRKFPIDPAVAFPENLAWREQPVTVETADVDALAGLTAQQVALGFDLALPLDIQIEAARRKLALLRHGLAKSGQLPPLTVRQGAALWAGWLRLLDATEAGVPLADIGRALGMADPPGALAQARVMSRQGYRRILQLSI